MIFQELKQRKLNIIPYIDQDDTSERVSCTLYLFHPGEKLEQLMSEKNVSWFCLLFIGLFAIKCTKQKKKKLFELSSW